MNSNHTYKIENIDCKDVISHVCENLGEPDDSPLCIAIQEHLTKCENCGDFNKSLSKIVELYKNYTIEMPSDVHNRLIEVLGLCPPDENDKK